MMKLYSYWRSSSAYRVRIALNLKELDHEIVPVSLVADGGEHKKPAYRAINPQGLVPFLQDGAVAIGQSTAILEYLEECYPQNPLLPEDSAGRAFVRQIVNIISCDIQPLDNLRVLKYLSNDLGVTDAQKDAWYSHWIYEGFEALETLLTHADRDGPYCFGHEITLADVYLAPQVYNAHRFNVEIESYPEIVRCVEACNKLAAFQAARPEAQPDAA